jgi:hypothetical protein
MRFPLMQPFFGADPTASNPCMQHIVYASPYALFDALKLVDR